MSTTETTRLEQLDPRYPRVIEYLDRGITVLAAHGIAVYGGEGEAVCTCKAGAGCPNPGKHPRGTWANPETGSAFIRSREEITRKLPPGEPWNVALPFSSGTFEDCLALDPDSDAARVRLLEEYGLDVLKARCVAQTANGWHAVYRIPAEWVSKLPNGSKPRNGASVFAIPGVDIRWGNGIIIAEPSVHASNALYTWLAFGEPEDAPAELLAFLETRGETEKPTEKIKPSNATKPSDVLEASSPVLNARRVERAIEEAASKIARQAQPGRHMTNAAVSFSLGITLGLRTSTEQARGLSELAAAFGRQAAHPKDSTKWAEDELEGIEKQYTEGLTRAAAGTYDSSRGEPIPADPPNSSSSAEQSPPIHDTGEDSEEENFRPGVRWKRLSEIGLPQPVEWVEGDIANGRIPRGELTIIMGEPGVGKGSITAQIVAEVTNAGGIVIISAPEDSLESVTLPRYMAAGAVLENVITVGYAWEDDEPWTPLDIAEHHSQILAIASETGGKLIILDPLEEHLTADAKSERETRLALRHLLAGCRALGCALLGIDHVNRMKSSSGYARAGGSSAKYKVARSVLIAGRQGSTGDEKDPVEQSSKPRIVALIPDKLNVGAAARGLRFELLTEYVVGAGGTQVSTAVARLLGETTLTAEELLGEDARESRETVSACAEWLRDYLTHRGLGHQQDETRKDARAVNEDWKADILKLAVKQLGGSNGPMGFAGNGGEEKLWGYKLPGYRPLGADRH